MDFDKLRRDHPLPDVIRASGVDLTPDGDEFRACCPFHGEKTPSFTVYKSRKGWQYHCFGCGAQGDVLDYVQDRYGLAEVGDAARVLTGDDKRQPLAIPNPDAAQSKDPYADFDILKPPADAPPIRPGQRTPPILNPKRIDARTGELAKVTYNPSMVFPYRTRKGDLLGYVLRVEIGDGKKITPGVWWSHNPVSGFTGWSHGSYPEPRPLYGLRELGEHPDYQVLLVEGEKCKDAAARLLQDFKIVPVSWMGGGKSISKVHWKSLAGRRVVLWPDADDEGFKTMFGWVDQRDVWHKGVIEYLFDAGVSGVKVIQIERSRVKDGWDIADAEKEDGLSGDQVAMMMRHQIREWTREQYEGWKARKISPAASEAAGRGAETGGDGRGQEAGNASPPAIAGPEEPRADDADDADEDRSPRPTGRGFEITPDTWRRHLIMKADGDGLKGNSLQNFALLLQYEPRFAGIFAWNDFAQEVYVMRCPPWEEHRRLARWTPRPISDPDVISAACWLEYCGMSPKVNDVGKVIQRVAQHNSYNPVTEALGALKWDGFPRLMGGEKDGRRFQPWLTRYLGADNTPINGVFGVKWMISAVARALQPGCKVDTMLILEGPQGLKKSSALRALSDGLYPGIFTDEIADIGSKDAGLQMQGRLVVEISELDAMRKAEVTTLKAWLSRQVDRFRRPYGKIVEDFPRHCVFAGSVNPHGAGYLKDPTGARRFWPVTCGEVDLPLLRADAPQLWAEAAHMYAEGWSWWLEGEEVELSQVEQNKRFEHDPWADMVRNYIRDMALTHVTTLKIMEHMQIPPERRNGVVNARLVSILLTAGWGRVTDDGPEYFVAPDRLT